MGKFDVLKLENQLCFPLYACSRAVVKRYRHLLDEIDLTYTQYITMLVFWEHKKCTVKDLGEKLYLDSGTLTPVLKSLEKKGFVRRYRSSEDERVVIIEITEDGEVLKEKAVEIPVSAMKGLVLNDEERKQLYNILYKALDHAKKC